MRRPITASLTLALALPFVLAACQPPQEPAASTPAPASEPARNVASEQGQASLTIIARGLSHPLPPAGAVLGKVYPSIWLDYYEHGNG